jgi:hypothetical protein
MLHSTPDGGIAVSILGPVSARLANGVSIVVSGDYPFDDNVTITLSGLPAGGLSYPLYVRVPSWASDATLSVNGDAAVAVGAFNGTMFRVPWNSAVGPVAVAVLATNPSIRVVPWFNESLAVFRGALLYSLRLDETFEVTQRNALDPRVADYIVSSPGCEMTPAAPGCTAPFNVAFVIDDPTAPAAGFVFTRTGPTPPVPFAAGLWGASNLEITTTVRAVTAWGIDRNSAAPPPASPVDCTVAGACGSPYTATLVPYGATHLRMSELPWTNAVQCPSVGPNSTGGGSSVLAGGADGFVFAGGASIEEDAIRSGNPGDVSISAYMVVARDPHAMITGVSLNFSYVSGYGPDNAPGGAVLELVAMAPGKCGTAGGPVLASLYTSPVLSHYPFDVCATCYSPPIPIDVRGLSLNASAGVVFGFRVTDNERNVQLKLPLDATVFWA